MNVVIFGGTGLLSSSITKKCIDEGYEIFHFNRQNTSSTYDVKNIMGNRYIKKDLEKVLLYNPDIIIDMLCFCRQDAEIAIEVFKGKVEQYIYCSTSCVYTPKLEKRIIYEESETKPFTQYGQDKLDAEQCFLDAMNKGYFNVTIFRPGHVFGRDFLVSNINLGGPYVLKRMLYNQDIILTERGERLFQACHATNVGLAFAKSCGLQKTYGKIYNIAGEEQYTWNDIYQIEKQLLNSNSRIIYKKSEDVIRIDEERMDFLKTYTKYNWYQSTEKLKNDIDGYNYITNFENGLKNFIKENESMIKETTEDEDLYQKILM